MKKSKIIFGAAIFAIAALFASCSNPGASSNDSTTAVKPFSFSGGGERTNFTLSADQTEEDINKSVSNIRAIETNPSLANMVKSDGLTQSLSINLIYKNRIISFKEFTGMEESQGFLATFGHLDNVPFIGIKYDYNPQDCVWVTNNGTDTKVILRKGDWDGKDFVIEKIVAGVDFVEVEYDIGVVCTVVTELKNPRFVEWNRCLSLIHSDSSSSHSYLNAYINNTNIEKGTITKQASADTNWNTAISLDTKAGTVNCSVGSWTRKWTDTVSNNCYGISYNISYEPKDDVNLDIKFMKNGSEKFVSFYPGEYNFLGGDDWWNCCQTMLNDNIPESLKHDLRNWDNFYNSRPYIRCANHEGQPAIVNTNLYGGSDESTGLYAKSQGAIISGDKLNFNIIDDSYYSDQPFIFMIYARSVPGANEKIELRDMEVEFTIDKGEPQSLRIPSISFEENVTSGGNNYTTETAPEYSGRYSFINLSEKVGSNDFVMFPKNSIVTAQIKSAKVYGDGALKVNLGTLKLVLCDCRKGWRELSGKEMWGVPAINKVE